VRERDFVRFAKTLKLWELRNTDKGFKVMYSMKQKNKSSKGNLFSMETQRIKTKESQIKSETMKLKSEDEVGKKEGCSKDERSFCRF